MKTHPLKPSRGSFTGLALAAVLTCLSTTTSAGSSLHLWYNDIGAAGDILINKVYVASTGPTTSYKTLGWNQGVEAGGYAGIQDHPSYGHTIIYLLWTPSNDQPITSIYAEPYALVESFDGKGTGMHIFTQPNLGGAGWNLGQWYTLLTRCWDYDSHTYFGLWFNNAATGVWKQIVTFDYPMTVRFNYRAVAFLENWSGQYLGYTRQMRTRNGWKRNGNGAWVAFTQGAFNVGTTGGVIDDAFYMESGLNSAPNITADNRVQTLTAPTPTPDIAIGQLSSASASYYRQTKTVTIAWIPNETTGPQFSYRIEIFNNAAFTGNPLITRTDLAPHLRSQAINVSSLAKNKTYYVRVRITDILDRASNYATTSFYRN